jgi:hypothetical protein
MDEALMQALNEMCEDHGLRTLDDVLADPGPHIYAPDPGGE